MKVQNYIVMQHNVKIALDKRKNKPVFFLALYYFLIFTIGRNSFLKQPIIWGGAILLTFLVLKSKQYHFRDISKESFQFLVFIGWTLLGLINVVELDLYYMTLKLLVEFFFMMLLLGLIIRKSNDIKAIWYAFLLTGIYNTVSILFVGNSIDSVSSMIQYSQKERAMGITDNANGLAFICFIGVIGSLGLIGEKLSVYLKLSIIIGGLLCLIGIILSGSRGGFFIFIFTCLLWSYMCFGNIINNLSYKWILPILFLFTSFALYNLYDWVKDNTKLGARTQSAMNQTDSSSQERNDLIKIAFTITGDNPIIGIGLGQFPIISKTGLYAHNEWAELFATTGIPGFFLYMSIYLTTWNRFTKINRTIKSQKNRYQISFGRMLLIVIVVSGLLFRINFVSVDALFIVGVIVGISLMTYDKVYSGKMSIKMAEKIKIV